MRRAATLSASYSPTAEAVELSFRYRPFRYAAKVKGLAWGKTVFHCRYCFGYELDRGRLGAIVTRSCSVHQALRLPEWGGARCFALRDECPFP